MVNALFIAVLLYGALGGFLYSVSNTAVLFSVLFALSLKYPRKRKLDLVPGFK
jgi:hypothetical protein